jgi:predicted amidohydrolase
MRVSGIQHDIAWEDAEATHAALAPRIAEAVDDGTDLVVLTEMFATGFSMEPERMAQDPGGASEQFLCEQASQHRVVVAGSIAQWGPDGRAQNVCILAGPDGVLARYAKIHPFSYGGEDLHDAPGNEVVTVEVAGARVTPLICYDLRFAPEFWNAAAETDCYLVVANWPSARAAHWSALLVARAIENQAYVVGVNRVGEGGGIRYGGGSAVIDPWGVTLDHLADRPGTVTGTVDPAEVTRIRTRYPFLADR